MAMSTCPKCDSHSFELQESVPSGSAFKLMFVQCSRCGAVVGVIDYMNVPDLLHKFAKALNIHLS